LNFLARHGPLTSQPLCVNIEHRSARPNPREFSPAKVLARIESLGWRLEHADHVWSQTAAATIAGMGGIGGQTFSGVVQGNYLFRNASSARRPSMSGGPATVG
jgi:hypothetical protein